MSSLKSVRLFAMCATLAGAGCTTSSAPGVQRNPDAGIAEADAQSEAEGESEGETKGAIICEDEDYTQADFDMAFATARDALVAEGYEVVPLTWEDDEGFNRLIDQMIVALGCTPQEQSSRRAGPGSCEVMTDFARYQRDVAYCGSGARRQPCGRRVIPGDCLNEVCYRHDLCYSELIAEQGLICMWSNDTERCDAAFHRGSASCLVRLQCGFRCRLIATAAANLDLLQEIGKLRGEECLYGTDPDSDGDDYSRFSDSDCDDGNAAINPGATEVCDQVDNDCDNTVDEGFMDLGNLCSEGIGACERLGILGCSADRLSVVCPAMPGTQTAETCDGWDNDCDGEVDERAEVAELCQDGIFCNGEERCEAGRCAIGTLVACDDGVSCTVDYCSESSRACSAVADHARCDDSTACTTDRCTATGCVNAVTLDADGDGFIAASCEDGTDCDDENAAINPDADEACDEVDNNCAGGADEYWSYLGDACTVGFGPCQNVGVRECAYDGLGTVCSVDQLPLATAEECNGVDDDCDGRVDNVGDCWVSMLLPGDGGNERARHTAVWTGSDMIVWGGSGSVDSGLSYSPTGARADRWGSIFTTRAAAMRIGHTAVWTGSDMMVWGGYDDSGQQLGTGGLLRRPDGGWFSVVTRDTSEDAPSPRYDHTAVWTGSEVIVWGGMARDVFGATWHFSTGGKYNPATNSWVATRDTEVPRSLHTAVWTGSAMIVWGGNSLRWVTPIVTNTGGWYPPSANLWATISTTDAPSARTRHTAIWTGSEMIVWGGDDDRTSIFNTGGKYNPATNSWVATTSVGAPVARTRHTAVWTGSEMIVWGGYDGYFRFNSGGRYNPVTDTWSTITTTNAPSARRLHTAVWTGSEMIIWGGEGPDGNLNTGGRYTPP